MDIIKESYGRLFPEKAFLYETKIEYNQRLAPFNANIKLRGETILLCMNLQWKDIDSEIKIGLVQSLLLKVLQRNNGGGGEGKIGRVERTMNIELYNNFIRNIPMLTPKIEGDVTLEEVFRELNGRFFEGGLEKPNVRWGEKAFRRLAHYNFHTDTITISETFREATREVLEYIMYHEMLHKELAFTHKEGRHSYHSPEFKRRERLFPGFERIEKEITQFVRKQKRGMRGGVFRGKQFWGTRKQMDRGKEKSMWQSILDYL